MNRYTERVKSKSKKQLKQILETNLTALAVFLINILVSHKWFIKEEIEKEEEFSYND